VVGGAVHRHAAADAVAEEYEAFDAEVAQHRVEAVLGLAGDEIQRQRCRMCVGPAEAEAVVGDDLAAGRRAQGLRKAAPQLDAAQRVVQQHDRRARAGNGRRPHPAEQNAIRRVDTVILNLGTGGVRHWLARLDLVGVESSKGRLHSTPG